MVYFFYIVGIFYRIFGIFYHSFGTFLLHFQEFIRLHICTNQLSLEKLRYVEDDGEDEGRDDVGGEVQGGGRGHLRMNKVKKSKMGHNFILKSTNIVTFLFQHLSISRFQEFVMVLDLALQGQEQGKGTKSSCLLETLVLFY